MLKIRSSRLAVVVSGAVIALVASGTAALAHIEMNPAQAAAGSLSYAQLSVAHGCDGSATTALSVQIPDGVTSVSPEVEPGWELAVVTGPYAQPIEEEHGDRLTEGVKEVTWRGGPVADGQLVQFGLSLRLPDGRPGDMVYFPTVQSCEQGEHRWITIPVDGQGEPEEPAPGLMLTAAQGDGHGHGGDEAAEAAGEATGEAEDVTPQAAGPGERPGATSPLTIVALVLAVAALALSGASFVKGRKPPAE